MGDVPVNTDEVNVTSITLLHELSQPIQTHAIGSVCHSGRAKVHFVLEGFGGLHMFSPSGYSGGHGDAGAACAGSDINRQ
jgi:hypothetical protein